MSEFQQDGTLGIEDKQDHPQRVKDLTGTESKFYYSAEELDKMRRATEELFKTKASKEDIVSAANGFILFANETAANTFFTNNPPAEDVLFKYTDAAASKADYYRRASDNTTQVLKERSLTEEDISQTGPIENGANVTTEGQLYDEKIAAQLYADQKLSEAPDAVKQDLDIQSTDKFPLCIYDKTTGWIYQAFDEEGKMLVGEGESNGVKFQIYLTDQWKIIIVYGQSFTRGASDTSISKAVLDRLYTFAGGVVTNEYADDVFGYGSRVAHIEGINPNFDTETPCYGVASSALKRIQDSGQELGELDFITFAPGQSGISIDALDKGTSHYTNLIEGIQKAYDLAQAAGKSISVLPVIWIHGQSDADFTVTDYVLKLKTLRDDLNVDLKTIIKDHPDLDWIIQQTDIPRKHNAGPVLAAYELAAEENNGFHLADVEYHLPHNPEDPIHMVSESYLKLGAKMGYVMARVAFEKYNWKGIYPYDVSIQGRIIRFKLNRPDSRFKFLFDEVTVNNPGAYGFRLTSDGSTSLTSIASIDIVNDDTIVVVSGVDLAPLAATALELRYALRVGSTGDNPGPTTGSRGNLRDNQGDVVKFKDPNLGEYPLHNWCPSFKISLNQYL
ncbi:hypothetical protein [Leeuwenhoekiella marinoflava]|uniref:Sialate O-acetylesterase domain-containing protein n=2 Tax=Leeuwenhoekiella marinoflava TaxID=988 RepID=A0A4Q0PNK2_9FLAO|nr:hypothetical protein [Leeuwenhoekiella marinoflava]RXG32033.1 hypothetical protein DSL99_1338 [Leeuwenhoekiella marinoflava]SHE95634.1 hypothetical protein SAMN02745246_01393 [Leeuwenhoekiella marinoflava DSM 3653]